MIDSILNINISSFENCQSTIPKETRLLSWLTNDKYREQVLQLRAIQDEDLQKHIKTSLPAITPSGVFRYRSEKDLIEHSGFLAFDIDFKDNQHIKNFSDLRVQLSHISSVAYCGLSVRGKGFWGMVPIPKSTPDIHKKRFSSLAKDFKEFGIVLDASGKDVCRLRIYSWDPDGYFNHSAKLYTKLPRSQQKTFSRPAYSGTRERVEAMINKLKENKIDITSNYKEEWLKIASALASEFAESGRGYFHEISQFHAKYSEAETDRMFDNVLKHDYSKVNIASFFKIANDYGLRSPLQKSVNIQKIDDIKVVKQQSREPVQNTIIQESEKPTQKFIKPETIKHGIWDQNISELEEFFKVVKLPSQPIKLNQCSLITDASLFIESNFSFVKAHNGNTGYEPYLDQLNELKSLLSSN
jgi:VirE N-terminal domain/Primase C terminal 2 (PriCT-2)